MHISPGRAAHNFGIMQPDWPSPYWLGAGWYDPGDSSGSRLLLTTEWDANQPLILFDLSANDSLSLPAPGSEAILDLRTLPFAYPNDMPREYFMIPVEYRGRALTLSQPGGVSYLLSVSEWNFIPDAQLYWGEVFEGWTLFDPAKPFRLVDLTTSQQTSIGLTDLINAPWEPIQAWPGETLDRPLVPVQIWLDGHQAGVTFTLHSRASGGTELLQSVTATVGNETESWMYGSSWQYIQVPAGSGLIAASVGQAMEFWLTRDADGAEGPHIWHTGEGAEGAAPAVWPLFGSFAPLPPPWVRIDVRVPLADVGDWFGYFQYNTDPWYGEISLTTDSTGTLYSYDDYGVLNGSIEFAMAHFELPPDLSIWAIDNSHGQGFYSTTPAGLGTYFDLLNWTPSHPQPPTISPNQLPFAVFGGRKDHQFSVHQPDANGNDTVTFIFVPSAPEWLGQYTTVYMTNDFGASVPVLVGGCSIENHFTTFEGEEFFLHDVPCLWIAYDASKPFWIRDDTTGEAGPDGTSYLEQWFPPTSEKLLAISSSRWGHDLWLVQPNGESWPVTQHATQGDLSLTATGEAWWNSYYWYDATVQFRDWLPWRLEDRDTGEQTPFHQPGDTPDFINWIALTAPHHLTAQTQSYTSIQLHWTDGDTDTGGGFRIERRVRVGTGQSFTPWNVIATLNGDVTSHVDHHLGAGSLAIYRVRAFFGPQASAPSNPAIAQTWIDLDGNGQPDEQPPPPTIVGGGNGPNPVGDPGPGGGGGGGDDGTPGDSDGDGDPDDDKDGVVDTHDRYPDDPRRSEDIPVKFFGVIDLSQYQYKGQPVPADNVTAIAIDDENRVSWINKGPKVSSHVVGPGNDYTDHDTSTQKITTWKDGEVTGVVSHVSDSWRIVTGLETLSNPLRRTETENSIGFGSVNGSGLAVGATTETDRTVTTPLPPGVSDSLGIYLITRTAPDGWAVPSAYLETDEWFHTDNNVINYDSSLFIGMSYSRVSSGSTGPGLPIPIVKAGLMSYVIQDEGHNRFQKYRAFRWGGTGPVVFPEPDTEPGPISNTAIIVNSLSHDHLNQSIPPRQVLWGNDDTLVQFNPAGIRLDAKAVNDQRQIVGDLHVLDTPSDEYPEGRGWLGFLWEDVPPNNFPDNPPTIRPYHPPNGQLTVFHDLLPERFRKQLRSAIPYSITNHNPLTQHPTILFTAEAREGSQNNPKWVPRTFILGWETPPQLLQSNTTSIPREVYIKQLSVFTREFQIKQEGIVTQNLSDVLVGRALTSTWPSIVPPAPDTIRPVLYIPVDVLAGYDNDPECYHGVYPFDMAGGADMPNRERPQRVTTDSLTVGTLEHSMASNTDVYQHWVQRDLDNFIVQVTLPNVPESVQEVIGVISTKTPKNRYFRLNEDVAQNHPAYNPSDPDYSDPGSRITLKKKAPHIYGSNEQVLVADAIDDQYSDPSPGSGEMLIADEQLGDRTHKIGLNGKVYLEVRDAGENILLHNTPIANVPIKKVVAVDPVILRNEGDPVVGIAQIKQDIKVARERLAPTGVWIESRTDNPLPADQVRYFLRATSSLVPDDGKLKTAFEKATSEGKWTYDFGTQVKALFEEDMPRSIENVTIYYVAAILDRAGHPAPHAFSTPPKNVPEWVANPYPNAIVIDKAEPDPYILSHELMHILLDAVHDDPIFHFNYRTLVGPRPWVWMTWPTCTGDVPFLTSRRIHEDQQKRARHNNRMVLTLPPVVEDVPTP